MRRLTTPEHRFPFRGLDPEDIKRVRITYAQGGRKILTKEGDDVKIDGAEFIVKLTQEETKRFIADRTVEIQVRVLTVDEEAPASPIFKTSCERVLDDEVMV